MHIQYFLLNMTPTEVQTAMIIISVSDNLLLFCIKAKAKQ